MGKLNEIEKENIEILLTNLFYVLLGIISIAVIAMNKF